MRRWWSAILALALAGIVALLSAPPASAAPSGNAADAPAKGPVVVVGIPDLRWQDLDPATTPTLWDLAGRSAVAALTDNSGSGVARRNTGWLTLNTGSRAVVHLPSMVLPDPTDPVQLATLREDNLAASYRAEVGALGNALRSAGLRTGAVGGPGAVLGAMAADGTVGTRANSVGEALHHADVVMVELPEVYDANRFDHDAMRAALTVIDNSLAQVLRELPENATLLVAGMSDDAGGPARLHVAMASGPAFPPGVLTSASTGRTGVVQLIDVAPTILWLTGTDAPSSMLGVHWRSVPGGRATTAQQIADFVDLDHRSVTVLDAVSKWYYPAVAWTVAVFVLFALLAFRRGRTHLLRPVGAVVASLPVASYLMQLVPWWRAESWPMAPLTLGIALLIGSVAAFAPWLRDGVWRTAGFVGGITAAVIALDAATGSPLSLDGPFADNPIVAGRFHGIGNVAFSLLGAGTLVFAAAISTRLSPRRAGLVAAVLGLLAVVVDGYPGLGDDFGGVLGLLPAVAVLALTLSRVRISWRHVTAVLAAAVLLTAGFAAYDYSRPASDRTHLGRFVAQVADGTGQTVVLRKLHTSLNSFVWGYGRWIVLCWLVLAVAAYLAHRRGRLQLRPEVDRRTAGGLLAALVVLAALGSGLNDSGLEVAAFTFFLAAPVLLPLLEPVGPPSGTGVTKEDADVGAAEVPST